jgi:hypothetical protein
VDVRINWVKGHNDILGNVLADRLATVGVMASKQKKFINVINIEEAEGYWKYTVNQHPFLANRRMYFNTDSKHARPGEYYLGDHGKEDDLLGKRISDGAYAVVVLDEPDNILELIRDHQIELARDNNTIVMIRLDHLFRPSTHQEINNHGTLALEQINPHRLDLACLDREPLTRELRPPKLAMRAIDAINELAIKLHHYLEQNPEIVTTDLTPILYDVLTKENKKTDTVTVTMKLKPEYNVGFAAFKVAANYKRDNEIVSTPITVTVGLDIVERNSLKRLESMSPKVTLITWLEAPEIFRYATIIEVKNAKGIWSGCYSNLVIVPKNNK